jgi:hypothetical protein
MADHRTTGPDGEETGTDREDSRTDSEGSDEYDSTGELPSDAAAEAERLTRLAREATVEAEETAYRDEREQLLADHGFLARVREADDTLVLHPAEWVEDGTVYPSKIDDTDRAVEISLSGPGDPDDWEAVERHNAAIVEAVRDAHGDVHGDNARALADFMGNHYARRMDTADAEELREFFAEYFPRNAWPSNEQRRVVEESIELVFEAADAEPPRF